MAHTDASDFTPQSAERAVLAPAPEPRMADPVIDLARPDFNNDFFKMASAGNQSSTFQLHPVDLRMEAAARPGDQPLLAGAPESGLPRLNYKNVDATGGFQGDVRRTIEEGISKLNPAAQKALEGLNIITASKIGKVLPGERDGAGLYVLPGDKPAHSIVLSENGLKADKQSTMRGVIQHELGHPLDAMTGGSKDPEFRAALEKGMKRLPPDVRREFAGLPHRAAEFFAEMVSSNMGTPNRELGYLRGLMQHFPEAKDWVKRKYFDR